MIPQNAYNSIPYSTTRDDRAVAQLMPETIGLDQRRLDALIAEMRSIAKGIDFLGENGERLGTWQQFLDDDALFFLVQIQQFSTEWYSQKKEELHLMDLMQTIDGWYRKAMNLKMEALTFELENAIDNQLKKACVIVDPSIQKALHGIWKKPLNEGGAKEITFGACITSHRETIQYVQSICKSLFGNLASKQNISKPHVALILGFLKLYKHIQNQFNGLTKRHLDYYYQDLLGQSKKVNEPERAFVFFKLAKEAMSTILQGGTLLLGGMEADGDEILFETTETLNVSNAKITDLITLHIANNTHISPHNKAGLITGIYQDDIQEALRLDPGNEPRQLFGQDGFETIALNPEEHSKIGWAVSGPIFMLKEGKRKVTLDFNIEKESLSALKKQIERLFKYTNTKEKVWMHRFFNKTFKLSLTTKEGWFSIAHFFSTINETETTYQLTFSFVLGIDDPSIVPNHDDLDEGSYQTGWPVLKIVLDEHKVYYPYSFLKDAKINAIHTKIEVDALQDLDVCNTYGKQDVSTPFSLFGPEPGKAATCYIGHDEWRYKNLMSLDFSIEWNDIETVNFKRIYKQYPGKVDTDSFKVAIGSLSNRQWKTPKDSSQGIPLFNQNNGVMKPETTFLVSEPTILKMVPDFEKKETLQFSEARNGYFRLQLTAPRFGFGHGIYGDLVNESVLKISKDPKKARKENVQIPQMPFTPEAQCITASYTAEQEFVLHAEDGKRTDKRFPFELFHIHPFGLLSTATQTHVKDRALLPRFEARGYLYMGLKDVKPLEELSFYFKIETQRVGFIGKTPLEVRWEYLLGTHWQQTSSTFLLYDGTEYFQHSGIVRIKMPKHFEHHHALFDEGKTWLRLSVPNVLTKQLGKVVCIQLNGVEAIRKIGENNESQTTLTQANAIDSIYTPIPEIQSVEQPFVPIGGVTVETTPDFYTRVSERLFHKRRGVLPSDFEVLILETFSQVYQASCFPATLFPEEIPPGTIQVMVLPFIHEDTPVSDRTFNGYTLNKIKRHLEGVAIHHKALQVCNPFYETIRVSCAVTFNEDYETGMALQTLTTTINRFIAPWMLQRKPDDGHVKPEHQVLDPSSLSSHLLGLPEVQHVDRLSMIQIHRFEEDDSYVYREATGASNASGLKPTKPWSVFVPSTSHDIDVVSEHSNGKATSLHIGTMEIENDFILKKHDNNENETK